MKNLFEFIVEKAIFLSGAASIIFVVLIFIFLLKEGLALFGEVNFFAFLFGQNWYPISDPPQFGILPLIMGSVFVTFGAIVIAVPLGLAAAIYISEVAPHSIRGFLKSGIELLAAIPSIVLGFIGIIFLAPLLKNIFHLGSGLTALAGSIMLAFMALPTIVSIIEDAIVSVPRSYKEGALALGATHWQAIYRVTIPAAASGILAAVMLGIGRVVGETMAVLMITGNAAIMPTSLLQPVRTLTATVAAEMGEAVSGSSHYYSLFAIGIVLFIISFIINIFADIFLHRSKAMKRRKK
ncbi:phosphate ABC transporter permease subunit PstC [candidate division WOR-1 bacterium RIFOXYA12_FULL_43_27]|uniref:Phosphate transport system permease protein n=1 Tax=candidate division WOR-1 bacterium RIFOXYC2_FULL_46_14 TaxID=1802587 RepID=A0A1F4U513_UNCSA|nr:MAG: phosphate ABC transporter permease subunit PstC [candidate division WOR-1 bacterium RIFOXYA12_FULL_43_27]OGC20677.1 MAG: phosphate ABC transporter permease subunit PstC [candidate division WOR-1 bacterium RIFOXYB2_FULL_46_45]OGC31586.1 MAG: phosphate ABC transporter permease subunit PstC [candidate division WOR-1 bacterium RIFOXYA2_FULL_46_56]OGC39991.1 MAG: phosphate ABC transporter permease subunit PstC [candidate division WOR-1 bacterium RIFOXYC2_FULL_46_14]